MRSLAFLLLALVACSKTETITQDPSTNKLPTDPSKAGDGTVSGSRIKAKTLTAEDGTKTSYGFYDSQREEDCSFQLQNGRYRCMPLASASVQENLFTDSACKKGVVIATKGCNKPSIAVQQKDYCPTTGYATTKVYAVGSRITSSIIFSKNASTGDCSETESTSYANSADLYAQGDAISLDEFVAADVAAE